MFVIANSAFRFAIWFG